MESLEFISGTISVLILLVTSSVAQRYTSCRDTLLGTEYVGFISTTKNGLQCIQWDTVTGSPLTVANNYCRNPDNDINGPWCFYTVNNFQSCDIPYCDDQSVAQTYISLPEASECNLRVQVCTGTSDDWQVGFIEVNNERMHTWDCPSSRNADGYVMGSVSASCREFLFHPQYPIVADGEVDYTSPDPSFILDRFMEEVYELVHKTSIGGYVVLASTGDHQNITELLYNDKYSDLHSSIADDLGLNNGKLQSGYDHVSSDLPNWQHTLNIPGAAVIIARKQHPEETVVKTIGSGYGPRLVEVPIDYTTFCIQPLTPLDSTMLDPENFGREDSDTLRSSVKLHIDEGNRIGCRGTVYGWEFIPANTGEDVWAGIFHDDSGTVSLIGSTQILLQSSSLLTDENLIQYQCIKQNPIYNVKPGYTVGYYTNATFDSNAVPPLKMVHVMPLTNSKYPCARQLTWGEADSISIYNYSKSDIDFNSTFSAIDELILTFVGGFALRPVMEEQFMFTCACTDSDDCIAYGDINLICVSSKCVCRSNYMYNRKANLCIYTLAARTKTASTSSTLNGDTTFSASKAVDADDRASALNGSCAKTNEGRNPWLLVDLGSEMEVYSIQLKTIQPLDVYLELWENASYVDSDVFVFQDASTNITADYGLSVVQKIRVHGPYPWKIHSSDVSNKAVINRNYENGENDFTYLGPAESSLGSVGENVIAVTKIEDFGYMTVGAISCWSSIDGNDYVQEENITSQCQGLVVYIEESDTTGEYYIRLLSDDSALTVNSFVDNAKVSFGAASTTFIFTSFANLLNGVGTTIIPANAPIDSCLYDNSGLSLTTNLNFCPNYTLELIIDGSTFPTYNYKTANFTANLHGSEPYLAMTESGLSTRPCYEMLDTGGYFGSYFTNVDDSGTDFNLAAVDGIPYNKSRTTNADISYRWNEAGAHDFTVGVSHTTTTTGDFSDFTKCTSYEGATPNGRHLLLDCDTPVKGRYVAIYMNNNDPDESFEICDFLVHAMLTGEIDDNVTEANLGISCNSTTCDCGPGLIYYSEASACIDENECRAADACGETGPFSEAGIVAATCENNYGSFQCICEDGYQFNGTHCVDIDEKLEWNCGCQHYCMNSQVDVTGFKYICWCDEGYVLSRDGHSCLDMDECTGNFKLNNTSPDVPLMNLTGSMELCLTKCAYEETCHCIGYNDSNSQCTLSANCSFSQEIGIIFIMLYPETENSQCIEDFSSPDIVRTRGEYSPSGCINTLGSYTCTCLDGLVYENGACVNLDECPGRCEGNCTDTDVVVNGTKYICDCSNLPGYEIGPDGFSCIDIDECADGNMNDCTANLTVPDLMYQFRPPYQQYYQGYCKNYVASYTCYCPAGYMWDEVHFVCADINECETSHACEFSCQNEFGGYTCQCDEGFELTLNNHTCEDTDECTGNNTCTQDINPPGSQPGTCVNTIGNYTCRCSKGYEYTFLPSVNLSGCYDIDECTTRKPCQDQCENKIMGVDDMPYQCNCSNPGLQLSHDGHTCVDIDECALGIDTCEDLVCVNLVGSYYCKCTGVLGSDRSCTELTGCMNENGGCEQTCTDIVDGVECDCVDGYELASDGTSCTDLDECTLGIDLCDSTAVCENTMGSYHCMCQYELQELSMDMYSCYWPDLCAISDNNMGCEDTCTSVAEAPGFVCSCPVGYDLKEDKMSCGDVDECAVIQNVCTDICMNTLGSFKCDCNEGYTIDFDGRTCIDVDECGLENGKCEDICINIIGSYVCSCGDGYVLWRNGFSCKDVNECVVSNDCQGETSSCINTPGSYVCTCSTNYALQDDQKTCISTVQQTEVNVAVRSSLDLAWIDQYADTQSSEYKNMERWLNLYFRDICQSVRPTLSCKLKGSLFQTSNVEGNAIVQNTDQANQNTQLLQIGPRELRQHRLESASSVVITGSGIRTAFEIEIDDPNLTPDEIGKLSYPIVNAITKTGNVIKVNDSRIPLSTPTYVNTAPDGTQNTWTASSPCDFFNATNYCKNGAVCQVNNTTPVCRCPPEFTGPQCNIARVGSFSETEIGLIATMAVLGALLFLLAMAVVWLVLSQTGKMPVKEKVVRTPSFMTVNTPGGWTKSPGYNDFFYNYK